MRLRLLMLFFLVPVLHAELPPSAYEAMQAKAPEYFKIEILRVDVAPGETPTEQNVQLVALITEVLRSASGAKPNDPTREGANCRLPQKARGRRFRAGSGADDLYPLLGLALLQLSRGFRKSPGE